MFPKLSLTYKAMIGAIAIAAVVMYILPKLAFAIVAATVVILLAMYAWKNRAMLFPVKPKQPPSP